MKLYRYSFILFLIPAFLGFSQQLPQYTQWTSHQFALNPAHAGIKNCLDAHSLFRTQWQGFEGAPRTGFVTISSPMNAWRKNALSTRQGIGAKIEVDRIGPISTNRLNLAYSSHFNYTADKRLSLGLYVGFIQFNYDTQSLSTIQPDPSISKDESFIKPDATFGVWWNTTNYYLGLSLKNLIPSKWNAVGSDSRFQLHADLNGGTRITLNRDYTLIPSFLLKIPPVGVPSLDLNAIVNYNNLYGFGFGIRNTNALLFLANIKLNGQFSLHYSFDYVLSPLKAGTIHSHEVSFIFNTCKHKQIGPTKCPLFE